MFNELYFSDSWQRIFAIDNSIPLWLAVLALSLWRGWPVGIALAGGALAHIAFDLPLHHNDGRAHFWPFSSWIFESPVSYWDSAHHARWVAPLGVALSLTCAVVIWRRHPGWVLRAAAVVLVALEVWTARQWILFF